MHVWYPVGVFLTSVCIKGASYLELVHEYKIAVCRAFVEKYITNMKFSFLGAILIVIGIINNVSAMEYIDLKTYNEYAQECKKAGFEKCSTVTYCAVGEGKQFMSWFLGSPCSCEYNPLENVDGRLQPACIVDDLRYQLKENEGRFNEYT